ncbi:hypothetical protein DICA3_F07074 [Diutina catenulata]
MSKTPGVVRRCHCEAYCGATLFVWAIPPPVFGSGVIAHETTPMWKRCRPSWEKTWGCQQGLVEHA